MSEPRPVKSFRAAGDRIVRQESAARSVVTRLLGAPMTDARKVTTDDDAWAVRLAALASLAQYDGLAFVVDDPVRMSRAHNVVGDTLTDPVIRALVDETRRSAATARMPTAVLLADGRAADVLLAAPLVMTEGSRGVLIAFRVGRSFTAADAVNAYGVAELLALELTRRFDRRHDDADRRQALALYELGRLAIFGDDIEATLHAAVAILANTVDHDVAHLWISLSDGSLELRAAEPQIGLTLGIVRPRDHGVLSEVLVQHRVVRVAEAMPVAWVPPDARSLLVAPLIDRGRPLGLLVLGRAREPYEAEDVEFAGVVASFIARLVAATATDVGQRFREPFLSQPTAEWRDERELLEELISPGN